MQHVKANFSTNGVCTGGIEMWWSPGEKNYLYAQWRPGHGLNEKNWSVVNVDPMYGDDLMAVAKESWNGTVTFFAPEYDG